MKWLNTADCKSALIEFGGSNPSASTTYLESLAQLVEHLTFNQGVVGSSPTWLTCYARMAELADAPDLGSGGQPWGFKSLYAHHTFAEVAQR